MLECPVYDNEVFVYMAFCEFISTFRAIRYLFVSHLSCFPSQLERIVPEHAAPFGEDSPVK